MKKKIVSIGIMICMLCLVILPTVSKSVKAATDLGENELLVINDYTITKTTTIGQINNVFGIPKIETESAFGGKAYSYYDDAYRYYLYIETDATGVIKAYGAINGNFKAKRYAQGDQEQNTYWYMSGYSISDDNNAVYGILEYNVTSSDVDEYWNRYEAKSGVYLYGLQKHAIAVSKTVANYAFPQTFASEDIFYRNEQLKYNQSNFYEYARNTGKTEYITCIQSSYTNKFYAYVPNPFSLGKTTRNYEYAENYAFVLYDIWMTDYTNRKYSTYIIYIDPSFLNEKKKVELTEEEKNKLAAAQGQYDLYNQHGTAMNGKMYEQEPQYKELPLDAGKYNKEALEMATSYLNIARAGIGMGTLSLDEEIADCAQHKATLVYYMNQNGMSAGHYPTQPDGVSDEFYNKAQSYMNENLYSGTIQSSIYYALNDGYGDPVTCGHRYNLLDPSYTKWGVGGVGSGISYGWQSVHKFSGSTSFDNELVAWPSNGIMPIDLVSIGIGNWTAQFYKGYKVTADSEVTIKCLNTDTVYEITKENSTEEGKYLKVSGNTLITFRDDSIAYENGDVFEITIHNMTMPDGTEGDYTYRSVFHSFYQSSEVDASGININTENLNLTVGQKERILALVEPTDATNKLMNFTSADENVAIVRQDGTVTAKAEGTTTITIECGEIKKEVTVVVSKALKGDINRDGYVHLYDAFKILEQAILGGELTEEELYIMDYNDDGKLNLYDAFKFLEQAILG